MKLQELLKARRLSRKMSQTDLASKADVAQSTVSAVECDGAHIDSYSKIKRLIKALRIPKSALPK